MLAKNLCNGEGGVFYLQTLQEVSERFCAIYSGVAFPWLFIWLPVGVDFLQVDCV